METRSTTTWQEVANDTPAVTYLPAGPGIACSSQRPRRRRASGGDTANDHVAGGRPLAGPLKTAKDRRPCSGGGTRFLQPDGPRGADLHDPYPSCAFSCRHSTDSPLEHPDRGPSYTPSKNRAGRDSSRATGNGAARGPISSATTHASFEQLPVPAARSLYRQDGPRWAT